MTALDDAILSIINFSGSCFISIKTWFKNKCLKPTKNGNKRVIVAIKTVSGDYFIKKILFNKVENKNSFVILYGVTCIICYFWRVIKWRTKQGSFVKSTLVKKSAQLTLHTQPFCIMLSSTLLTTMHAFPSTVASPVKPTWKHILDIPLNASGNVYWDHEKKKFSIASMGR